MAGGTAALAPFGSAERLRTLGIRVLVVLGFLPVALLAVAVIVAWPELLRLLLAVSIAAALILLSLFRPRAGVLATAVFLVALALLRRVLIPYAGWGPFDPLLLVGPLVAGLLVVKLFVLEKRGLPGDRMSQLVLVVLGLAVLQIANPLGGGVAGGLGGFMFVGVPLIWFLIGRELNSEALTSRLLDVVMVGGVAIGLYGLMQTEVGMPSWDQAWLQVAGYSSLNVGDQTRAFGTFSSSAEYALFLGSALAIAAARVLQGRPTAFLAIPPLALALFLSSSRGALVTAFFAVVVVGAMRSRRPAMALVVTVLALGGAFGLLSAVGGSLSQGANNSGSDLVSHQVGGVTDPLNSDNSTLIVHLEMAGKGLVTGFKRPLGSGTGSTNQAGSKLTAGRTESTSTEVDISNAFVGLGLVGGLAYLALFGLVLFRCAKGYFDGNDLLLPVTALLLVGMGQWLTGGHYALATITWLLIGWVAAVTAVRKRAPTAEAHA